MLVRPSLCWQWGCGRAVPSLDRVLEPPFLGESLQIACYLWSPDTVTAQGTRSLSENLAEHLYF